MAVLKRGAERVTKARLAGAKADAVAARELKTRADHFILVSLSLFALDVVVCV